MALAVAITKGADFRIWNLFEAGTAATIHLRLTTSHTQVLIDALVWSETIRATHMSNSCGILNFVEETAMVPEVLQEGTSVEKMRQLLAHLGVQVRSRPVDKSIAMGVLALVPVVSDDACMQSPPPNSGTISQTYE